MGETNDIGDPDRLWVGGTWTGCSPPASALRVPRLGGREPHQIDLMYAQGLSISGILQLDEPVGRLPAEHNYFPEQAVDVRVVGSRISSRGSGNANTPASRKQPFVPLRARKSRANVSIANRRVGVAPTTGRVK